MKDVKKMLARALTATAEVATEVSCNKQLIAVEYALDGDDYCEALDELALAEGELAGALALIRSAKTRLGKLL